jgi:hypothetical protein
VGATQRTFAIRTSQHDEVKARLFRWLSAKGFDETREPALFARGRSNDDECGLCLMSNGSWVVVLYSHMFREEDRLRFELTRPEWPLLGVWTYDSDIWGYDLFDDGTPVAAFNSNPRYFGPGTQADAPAGTDGDPERLCRVLRLGPVEETIARLQQRRAIFAEANTRKFCHVIGAEPAAYDYRDLQDVPSGSTTAAGWQVDHLRFVERGARAIEAAPPLHAMVRKPLVVDEEAVRFAAELHARLWPIHVVAYSMRLLIYPLVVLLRILFQLSFWFQSLPFVREIYERRRRDSDDALFAALEALARPPIRREGATLVNDLHRCQITLPAGAIATDDPSHGPQVFQFKIGEMRTYCNAVGPEWIQTQLREMPGMEITGEECFFVGTLQARAWSAAASPAPNAGRERYTLIVQTPRAFYHFTLFDREPIPEDVKRLLRSIVESFRTF